MYHHIIWWLLIMHTPPLLLRRRRRLNHCVSTTELRMRFQIHRFRLHYVFNCTAHVRLGAAMHLVYLMMIRWMQHKYIINRHIFSSALLSSPQFFLPLYDVSIREMEFMSVFQFNNMRHFERQSHCQSQSASNKFNVTNEMRTRRWMKNEMRVNCVPWQMWVCLLLAYTVQWHDALLSKSKATEILLNQNLHNVNPALKLYVFFFPLFTVHLTWNVKSVKCKH